MASPKPFPKHYVNFTSKQSKAIDVTSKSAQMFILREAGTNSTGTT